MHFLQFESERGQTWPLQRQQLCCSDYDGWVRNGGGFGFKADSLLFKASKGLSPSLGRFAKICQGAAKIGIQRVALRPRPFQRSSTRLRCRRSRVATRCPFIIALQTDTSNCLGELGKVGPIVLGFSQLSPIQLIPVLVTRISFRKQMRVTKTGIS